MRGTGQPFADFLRDLSGTTGVLGRITETRFAMVLLDAPHESAEEIWLRIRSSAAKHSIALGAAIFEPADSLHLDALLDRAEVDLRAPALMARTATVRT